MAPCMQPLLGVLGSVCEATAQVADAEVERQTQAAPEYEKWIAQALAEADSVDGPFWLPCVRDQRDPLKSCSASANLSWIMQHFLSQLCQDLDSPSVSVWFPGDIHVKEVTLTTIVLESQQKEASTPKSQPRSTGPRCPSGTMSSAAKAPAAEQECSSRDVAEPSSPIGSPIAPSPIRALHLGPRPGMPCPVDDEAGGPSEVPVPELAPGSPAKPMLPRAAPAPSPAPAERPLATVVAAPRSGPAAPAALAQDSTIEPTDSWRVLSWSQNTKQRGVTGLSLFRPENARLPLAEEEIHLPSRPAISMAEWKSKALFAAAPPESPKEVKVRSRIRPPASGQQALRCKERQQGETQVEKTSPERKDQSTPIKVADRIMMFEMLKTWTPQTAEKVISPSVQCSKAGAASSAPRMMKPPSANRGSASTDRGSACSAAAVTSALTFKIAGQKGISSQQVTLLHENTALTRWSALAEAPDVLQLVVVPPAHAVQRQAAAELLSQLENSRPYAATINQITKTDWSVLGDRTTSSAVMLNHVPTVRLLLRARADTNCTDDDSKSALHLAAAGGSSVVARLLLENRAIINRPEDTETPLHAATAVGHPETASILLEAQAQVNRTGKADRTALHCAAVAGAGPVVSALVAARAEIHRQDRNRKVALQYAVSSDDVLSVDVLLSAGAAGTELKIRDRVPVLHYALTASTEAMVEHVLQRRADLDATDPKGRLPFLLAAARSDSGFIKLLCKWRPLDAEDIDRALCVACEKGNSSVVQFLLHKRANPSSRTEETTALHLAAAGGYEVVIRELLHAKADANCKDSKSRIPWKVCKGKSLAELLRPSR
eukprot:s761_g12.t1